MATNYSMGDDFWATPAEQSQTGNIQTEPPSEDDDMWAAPTGQPQGQPQGQPPITPTGKNPLHSGTVADLQPAGQLPKEIETVKNHLSQNWKNIPEEERNSLQRKLFNMEADQTSREFVQHSRALAGALGSGPGEFALTSGLAWGTRAVTTPLSVAATALTAPLLGPTAPAAGYAVDSAGQAGAAYVGGVLDQFLDTWAASEKIDWGDLHERGKWEAKVSAAVDLAVIPGIKGIYHGGKWATTKVAETAMQTKAAQNSVKAITTRLQALKKMPKSLISGTTLKTFEDTVARSKTAPEAVQSVMNFVGKAIGDHQDEVARNVSTPITVLKNHLNQQYTSILSGPKAKNFVNTDSLISGMSEALDMKMLPKEGKKQYVLRVMGELGIQVPKQVNTKKTVLTASELHYIKQAFSKGTTKAVDSSAADIIAKKVGPVTKSLSDFLETHLGEEYTVANSLYAQTMGTMKKLGIGKVGNLPSDKIGGNYVREGSREFARQLPTWIESAIKENRDLFKLSEKKVEGVFSLIELLKQTGNTKSAETISKSIDQAVSYRNIHADLTANLKKLKETKLPEVPGYTDAINDLTEQLGKQESFLAEKAAEKASRIRPTAFIYTGGSIAAVFYATGHPKLGALATTIAGVGAAAFYAPEMAAKAAPLGKKLVGLVETMDEKALAKTGLTKEQLSIFTRRFVKQVASDVGNGFGMGPYDAAPNPGLQGL